MPIRRISTPDMYKSTGDYDHTHSYLQGYKIDWSRMTAVQSRQSAAGADFANIESRLNQESLPGTALEMRPDHNLDMILPLDEGAGVSGQKKIYQRPKLKTGWDYLVNGLLGTWFVAREDRLFRDRHGTQSSAFTEKCQEHRCILIIPGKRCYDFSRDDDLATFKKRMEEAAAYLRHVEYMNTMQMKKQARGEWVGGAMIAPYAIDKVRQMRVKEYIKQQRLLGLRASDIDFTLEMSQAYRPIVYTPWLERTLDLFNKIKLFNYQIPRLMRYIEEKPYLFPFPTAEDYLRYLFKMRMKQTNGGYTFTRPVSVQKWLINLLHMGCMSIGEDEESGEHIYLEDCFQGAVPRDQFEETYIELMGEDLDGNLIQRVRNKGRFTRAAPTGHTDALLTGLFKSDYAIYVQITRKYWYYRCSTKAYQEGTLSENTYMTRSMWQLPITQFDREIVNRLATLAEHDKELAERVRTFFERQKESKVTDKKLITDDILKMRRKYAHLQWLKTNEELGQTVQQIQEIVKEQTDLSQKIATAQIELEKLDGQQPGTTIPRFYDILGHIPTEFWKQDLDHRRKMMRLLIDSIQIENIAPHVYALCVNWIAPVSTRGDTALLYRWSTLREEWTPEEERIFRMEYPRVSKEELLRHLPNRSWHMFGKHANVLGVRRREPDRYEPLPFHRHLTYNDWSKTCEYYGIDRESEEGQKVLDKLNSYAIQAERGRLKFMWLLPAEKATIRAILDKDRQASISSVFGAEKIARSS